MTNYLLMVLVIAWDNIKANKWFWIFALIMIVLFGLDKHFIEHITDWEFIHRD